MLTYIFLRLIDLARYVSIDLIFMIFYVLRTHRHPSH
jgi:hypothetical protein